ncbi:MAG: DUF6101 family protein [Nitratireductor sp.]
MANVATKRNADQLRLDPYTISDRISFERAGVSYTIDRMGVSVKKTLAKCGLPLSLALPAKSFKGVAARALQKDDGTTQVSLELHHHDPELCVPVLVADNMDDISADWHSWSRLLKLPMIIIDAQNIATAVRNELGMVMVEHPLERRKRVTTQKQRGWFLRRRKMGTVSGFKRIQANEIIARN